jgi:hypothetical protein
MLFAALLGLSLLLLGRDWRSRSRVPIDVGLQSVPEHRGNHAVLVTLALVAVVLALLAAGPQGEAARGAAMASELAAGAIVVSIVLATLGRDYVLAVMPAGMAAAASLLGVFAYSLINIDPAPQYQRPDWRGLAAARATPTSGSADLSRGV